jgi:hypothetical protein
VSNIQRYDAWPQECPFEDKNGEFVTYEDHIRLVKELEAKLARAVEALDEAVYLLDVTEEDITKGAGVYRIVNTLKELTGEGGTHDKNL